MRKILSELIKPRRGMAHRRVNKMLGEENAAYVLITCGKPTSDGKMQVEMSYEGDATLAAYLLESAQDVIDEDIVDGPQSS
jgi:hypothetical protein